MWNLVWALLALLFGIGLVTACVFWNQVRDCLAAWLRAMGWEKSVLMDAVIVLDNIAGKVRSRLFATTRKTGTVLVDETVYTMDQIDDPEVLAELRKHGVSERSVLNLVN